MARACQCDICGDLYKPYTDKANSVQLVITTPHSNCLKNYYDCCPACMATLNETIKLLGDNKHEQRDDI